MRKGQISVDTKDIFPIIKKWLYSEHDIFLRELVSNASDAITKRKNLGRLQNQEIPAPEIKVEVNPTEKKIIISDNGIGMTEAEVEKYIAQLAFSGAQDFAEKMKKEGSDTQDIIGKFGLGFYSCFMVSDKVEIDTLSMNKDAIPVRWTCKGQTDYTFAKSTKNEAGTTITLSINEESQEFLNSYKVEETLRKFCDFMPYPITVFDTDRIKKEIEENEKKTEEKNKTTWAQKGTLINNMKPLWKQDPTTLKDEDYLDFYRRLYPMEPDPLFWLHLNIDHPFTLEGVLYFPKLNMNKPFNESNIRLYSKEVFVSDNIKNIIPQFLILLRGVIDSTDIPLNVSRSSLQGDPNIKKISNYIIKKVADALTKLFKTDRPKFEMIWEDIGLFVKYGFASDEKFADLVKDIILFKNSQDKYMTLNEYNESIPDIFKEKLKGKILYFEKDKYDPKLTQKLLEEKILSLETDDHIDPHFMQAYEMKNSENKFVSIESEIATLFASGQSTPEDMKIKEMFKDAGIEIELAKVEGEGANIAGYFKVDEQMKRYAHMTKMMGQKDIFPLKKTLMINPNNRLVKKALEYFENDSKKELGKKLSHYIQDLAIISSDGLKNNEKDAFVKRSLSLMEEVL